MYIMNAAQVLLNFINFVLGSLRPFTKVIGHFLTLQKTRSFEYSPFIRIQSKTFSKSKMQGMWNAIKKPIRFENTC